MSVTKSMKRRDKAIEIACVVEERAAKMSDPKVRRGVLSRGCTRMARRAPIEVWAKIVDQVK